MRLWSRVKFQFCRGMWQYLEETCQDSQQGSRGRAQAEEEQF